MRRAPGRRASSRCRVRSGGGEALLSAVDFYARLAALGSRGPGKTPVALKSTRQDGVEVKYLSGEGAFPPGIQPAYALKDGYLILASSPDALRRFGPAKKPANDNALIRLSGMVLNRYVTEHRDALVSLAVQKHNLPRDEVARRLDGLRAALGFIERIELGQSSDAGQLSLTLRIQTILPLK